MSALSIRLSYRAKSVVSEQDTNVLQPTASSPRRRIERARVPFAVIYNYERDGETASSAASAFEVLAARGRARRIIKSAARTKARAECVFRARALVPPLKTRESPCRCSCELPRIDFRIEQPRGDSCSFHRVRTTDSKFPGNKLPCIRT